MASPVQLVSLSRRERNANINVGSFNPSKKHSDKARWICIYPAYLNSKKTLSDGRKVPANKAVENPTIGEIRDVLANAGLPIEIEPAKCYPKELNKCETNTRGRVRVQLKNDDGTPFKANFPTRDSILIYLAETIPKLKTRGSSSAQSSSSQQQQQSEQSSKSGSSKKASKKK